MENKCKGKGEKKEKRMKKIRNKRGKKLNLKENEVGEKN